jgi:hypothetical protein
VKRWSLNQIGTCMACSRYEFMQRRPRSLKPP